MEIPVSEKNLKAIRRNIGRIFIVRGKTEQSMLLSIYKACFNRVRVTLNG